jgi:hypothetical protein
MRPAAFLWRQERPDYFIRRTPYYNTESGEDLSASCNTDGSANSTCILDGNQRKI